MKKRRTLIISLLLVAALVLGVGYAATVVNLSVTNNVSAAPSNADVVFTAGTISVTGVDGEDGSLSTNDGIGTKAVKVNLTRMQKPEHVTTITLTIKNNSAYSVKLQNTVIADSAIEGLFTVAVTQAVDNVILPAQGVCQLVFTVTPDKAFTTDIEEKIFTITFDAVATEEATAASSEVQSGDQQ